MRLRSRAAVAAGVAAALIGGAVLVDTAAASRAESALSERTEADTRLSTAPDVYIAGFPFSQVAVTKEVPRVSVSTLDVDVAGLGVVNTGAEAFDIEVPVERAAEGDFVGSPAAMVRRKVRLDGVAFGELLGMTDLDIANPYDISPGGGVASEAQLTGTVPGTEKPSTVIVTLRLDGGTFRMRPSLLVDIPSGAEDEVLAAYTLDRDTRDLPLGGPADIVQLSGGSIEFIRQRYNVVLDESDLAPLPPQ
ncbi:LmeA family phospholipid-binding protein [Corynebacterium qintianiae]|nr:DUF2993 domain-containing protein [Corynebacterium qintianiae]